MDSEDTFPHELLSAPMEARLKYFDKEVIVAHPKLIEAYNQSLAAIRHPGGASMVFLCGPTGVGKTTLRRRLEQQLIEEALFAMELDPGFIPVAAMEVVSTETGRFDWKDHWWRGLLLLDEPMIDRKIDYEERGVRRNAEGRLHTTTHANRAALRRAFEKALIHRQLQAMIYDEAQHFGKTASGRRLLDQMDVIKSVANVTGTLHVLIGPYELLDLIDLNSQLTRRGPLIHFPRYRFDDLDDEAFQSILLTFQRSLPLPTEPNLVERYDYLYKHSLGCVGVLKDWLYRALAAALEEGEETLCEKHLEASKLSERRLLKLVSDMRDGERTVATAESAFGSLESLLGMDEKLNAPNSEVEGVAVTKTRTTRVGQRNPVRDPVGMTVQGG